MKLTLLLASALAFVPFTAFSQTASAPHPAITTVNPDDSITFRLTYPGAKHVIVTTDASLRPLTMTKDANGVWSVTTPPLAPEHYQYTFVVDGVSMLDPLNRDVHPNFVGFYSDILVPGNPPKPWELTDIPHGNVTRHFYTTHIGLHYPYNQTAYVVYTPPGYNPKLKGGYPVLYLLHGYSDTEEGWIRSGKANLMLDTLLANDKIVPMVVVMPRGYGDLDVVAPGQHSQAMFVQNGELFGQMLLKEIIPAIQHTYNVAKGRQNRAIAGLSMGGSQSLLIGLSHPELFAWVGGLSAGLPTTGFDRMLPAIDAHKDKFRLVWIACGTDDPLIAWNRAFVAWARKKGLPVTAVEKPGAHTWIVWRPSLLALAPLLFRK
ncbi:MAG: esterase [Acidobacteriaceae bacterium]